MGKSLLDRMREHAEAADRRLIGITNDVAVEYSRVMISYQAQYKDAITRADFSESTAQRLAVAREISSQVEQFLIDAGSIEFRRSFAAQHAQVATLARSYFDEFKDDLKYRGVAKISGASRDVLRELTAFNVENLGVRVEQNLVTPLRSQLISGVLADQSALDIKAGLLNTASNLSTTQIEGLIDDTYSQFYRTVHDKQAEDLGLDVIYYLGPDDSRTSAQCEFMLDYDKHGEPGLWLKKEFTQRHINNLLAQSGVRGGGKKSKIAQLTGDPKIQGGHFRCRHHTAFMTRAAAEEEFGVSFGK